ncbi:hypothetical protein [Brucella pseudintermedia]|uniref:hypothetical protein n=1 Tax=Brucella pseudintermedia TaxID=370111 RepID=UPI00124F5DEA|nr:hypothetical protein [Brucella pseudintermedia]KAB2680899.1 hypothetical protein F9K78_14905 [Brucella pseudintermedia]
MTGNLFHKSAVAAAIALGLSATSAAALEKREAEAVVAILERLSSETGKTVFYDEDAAQEWFEIDDESSQLIPAAGFSETRWKAAFDQTMTGFIASIPQAELEQLMEEFADKLGELGKMTPEQKKAATEMLRAQMGNFDVIREKGAPYRNVAAPYADRLKRLSKTQ